MNTWCHTYASAITSERGARVKTVVAAASASNSGRGAGVKTVAAAVCASTRGGGADAKIADRSRARQLERKRFQKCRGGLR